MYGLKEATIEAIQRVFRQHAEVEEARIYGSRAKGNYRNGSDIDLALKGENLTLTLLLKIETELDDLMLPYKMDVCLFHKIENGELVAHIDRVGMVFFVKEEAVQKD